MLLRLLVPLKIFGGMLRRAPPLFSGRLVVIMTGSGFGFSGGSSGGCVKSGVGANSGCLGSTLPCDITMVSMWSVGTSCASLKLCCVAVDSLLDEDEDALGSKPKPAQRVIRAGRSWICMGSG